MSLMTYEYRCWLADSTPREGLTIDARDARHAAEEYARRAWVSAKGTVAVQARDEFGKVHTVEVKREGP